MYNTISNKTIVELSHAMTNVPAIQEVQDTFEEYCRAKVNWDGMRRTICRSLVVAMATTGEKYSLSDLAAISGVSTAGVYGYLSALIRSRTHMAKGMPTYVREELEDYIIHSEKRTITDKWVQLNEDGTPNWGCERETCRRVTYFWVTRA